MRLSLRTALLCATATFGLTAMSSASMAQTQIFGGGSTLAQPTYGLEFTTFNDPSINWNYAGVGSGSGQGAFLTQTPSLDGYPAGTTIHYGTSDAALIEDQVTTWNSTEAAKAGGLIQVPTFGTPVTVPFKDPNHAALKLNDNDLCGIFSGKITDWSQVTAGRAGTGAITVVYRADGSGTSYLTTSHLAQVCDASNSNITFTPQKTFASLFPNSTPPANFIGETGSGGVEAELLSLTSAIGYLSPDYTSIAPNSPNTSSLKVASLINATSGIAYQPTTTATTLGLKSSGPGAQFTTAPTKAAGGNPADPVQWVPLNPQPVAGYSIVGYTTWDAAQCYKSKPIGTAITNFLKDEYSSVFAADIANGGFVPVPGTYATQIKTALLGNSAGLGLNIDNPTACSGKGL